MGVKCLAVGCPLDGVDGRRVCAAHADYFDRVLRDNRFMRETPPSMYVVPIRRGGELFMRDDGSLGFVGGDVVDVGQQGALGL